LQDPTEDLTVRQSAARALGRIGQLQAVQPLIAMFRTQAITVDPDTLASMQELLDSVWDYMAAFLDQATIDQLRASSPSNKSLSQHIEAV
jgi:HEAT repeat protein